MFLSSRNNNDLWSLSLFCLFAILSSSALSASTNVTIDDEDGDSNTGAKPSYLPLDVWNQGDTCSGCLARPDPLLAFDGTWHDSTVAPGDDPYTIEVSFTGTAVYAFFILANNVEFATTFTSLSFSLDGKESGTFVHIPTSSTEYQYNVPAFVSTSLENTKHNLIISNVGTTNDSLVLFDYLVYTVEDDVETKTSLKILTNTKSSIPPSPSPSPPPPSTSTSPSSLLETLTRTTPSSSSLSSIQKSSTDVTSTSQVSTTDTDSTSISPTAIVTTITQNVPKPGTSALSSATSSVASVTTANPSISQSVSHKTSNRIGAILGGLIGGAVAIALVVLLLLCCRRRRKMHKSLLAEKRSLDVPINEPLSAVDRRASTQTSTDFLSLGSARSDSLYLDSRRPDFLPSLFPNFRSRVGAGWAAPPPLTRPISELESSPFRGAVRNQGWDSIRQEEPVSARFDMEKATLDVDSPDAGRAELESRRGNEPLRKVRDDLSWADDGSSGNDEPLPEYYSGYPVDSVPRQL